MERTFWQSIVDSDYDIPKGYAPTTLTADLLPLLGSTDPELRDAFAYPILAMWIERDSYDHDALRAMATQMIQNLTVGLGEQGTDTVFLRAFSALILTCIIEYDNTHPFVEEHEVREWLEAGLHYFAAEQDRCGYLPIKGWAHSVAHTADLLMMLAKNRYLGSLDLERILNAIAEKVIAPVAFVYLYLEDERLAYAVVTTLRKDLLSIAYLTEWLNAMAHPQGRKSWVEAYLSEVESSAFYNTRTFLRSLYFQLFLNEQPPVLAADMLPKIVSVLKVMDRGFYMLP